MASVPHEATNTEMMTHSIYTIFLPTTPFRVATVQVGIRLAFGGSDSKCQDAVYGLRLSSRGDAAVAAAARLMI